MIDRNIHLARALLVESNSMLRSTTVAQLKDLGIGHVSQASRVNDARTLLERERFDIVICNREFERSDLSGQDLLDELRREQLLPHSTVFLMITSQATYAQVVEAAESALDGFLLRPYTTAALSERLQEARNRKRVLGEIHGALDAGQVDRALAAALQRFESALPYAAYCGRLAAELLLRLQRPGEARSLFERLADAQGAAWARLGVARALMASGDNSSARKAVLAVLDKDPGSADAQDLLGRILVEQCDFDGALAAYRRAAELTPGCLLRAQHNGALAFYQGQADEAVQALERSVAMGLSSKLFDALSLLLLALLRHDRNDTSGVMAARDHLRRQRQRQPESSRLMRFEAAAEALVALRSGAPEAALDKARQLAAEADDEGFDLEASNVALALWARLPDACRPASEHEDAIERLGMRFCTTKATAEVLMAAAGRDEGAVAHIRRCQARVSSLAEAAMAQSLRGEHIEAVQSLLEAGETTRNARLLDLAGNIARRHQAQLVNGDALIERLAGTRRRFGRAASHIAGIQRSGRSPGGLQLRG